MAFRVTGLRITEGQEMLAKVVESAIVCVDLRAENCFEFAFVKPDSIALWTAVE